MSDISNSKLYSQVFKKILTIFEFWIQMWKICKLHYFPLRQSAAKNQNNDFFGIWLLYLVTTFSICTNNYCGATHMQYNI